MGIPYSKQINAAFDEVTPLVAAGFDVLRTSRNISILLAAVQIFTVLLLGCILLALLGLLITISPDLEDERRVLVTPAVRWLAAWAMETLWLRIVLTTVGLGVAAGGLAGWYVTREVKPVVVVDRGDVEEEEGEETAKEDDDEDKDGQTSDKRKRKSSKSGKK